MCFFVIDFHPLWPCATLIRRPASTSPLAGAAKCRWRNDGLPARSTCGRDRVARGPFVSGTAHSLTTCTLWPALSNARPARSATADASTQMCWQFGRFLPDCVVRSMGIEVRTRHGEERGCLAFDLGRQQAKPIIP